MADISFLAVVPQIEEFEPLVRRLEDLGGPRSTATAGRLELAAFPALRLGVAVGGHGKVQMGVQTQHLLDHLPDAATVLCVGAAGGLGAGVGWGDVVVAERTIEHDYTLRFVAEPPPVHACLSLSPGVLAGLQPVSGSHRVHHGPIASGDEDVVSPERAAELHRRTGALCVAWEGAGAARAARFSGRGFLEIRGITDGADEQAARTFRESLKVVLPRVAETLAAWIGRTMVSPEDSETG